MISDIGKNLLKYINMCFINQKLNFCDQKISLRAENEIN